MEIALDHANKANADAQKSIKKYQQLLKDLQTALEEEQRARDEAREQYAMVRKKTIFDYIQTRKFFFSLIYHFHEL